MMRNNKSPRNNRQDKYRDDDHEKINGMLNDIMQKLEDSIDAIEIRDLNPYERKQIHTWFDSRPAFKTKTYRNNDDYILKIYPIGNLKGKVEKMAQEVLETGKSVFLHDLGNFERFIVHDYLKTFDGIETLSSGEGTNRVLEIKRKQFGRSLKRIMKKIKLV